MSVLAVVTARGGSKGFPRKNLALLAGRSLTAWAWQRLDKLRRRHPELVLKLSTDDAEIAATWPEADRPHALRPASLATDEASSWSVVEHEMQVAERGGITVDAVLLLQPTSALVSVEDLEALWRAFAEGGGSVVGVTEDEHPIRWSHVMDQGGVLKPAITGDVPAQRQEATATFRPVGVYMAAREFLLAQKSFLTPGASRGVLIPRARAVDIDVPEDLTVARALMHASGRSRRLRIGRLEIADGAPCFVIAEAGVNHNGDVEMARQLVHAAADAGASAVKFQTFSTERLVTLSGRQAEYQKRATGVDETQWAMLKRLELPLESLVMLKREAESRGLVFLSSPFDVESVRLLDELGVDGFKLPSGELTNASMIEAMAQTRKPLIISTGMCTLEEVERAAAQIRSLGDPPVAWLHCLSAYPAPAGESNLRAMESLRLAMGGPVGMSDHTMGWEVAIAAVALGARVLEKHLTLSRGLPGPDHQSSLESAEFTVMMEQIRRVESALGNGVKRPMPSELDTRSVARKSLVTVRALAQGERLSEADIVIKRPGTGIEPHWLKEVIGREIERAVAADEPLSWSDLKPLR